MKNIISSLKQKKLKKSTVSGLVCLFAILALIAINIAVKPIDRSYDLTAEKRYTLSEQTIETIKNLDADITIYALFDGSTQSSSYYDTIVELLERYAKNSDKITLIYRDPAVYPNILEKYRTDTKTAEGLGIVVENGDKFYVISPNELIVSGFDYTTYQPYVQEIVLEQQVTNAILYVTGDTESYIYCLTGHNETRMGDSLKTKIESSNYAIKDINLLTTGEIPTDCDLLFITTPERDYAPMEKELITGYIENGGKVFASVSGAFQDFPVLYEILGNLGIEFDKSLIVERGVNNYYPNMNPATIIPKYPEDSANEIVEYMLGKNAMTLTPYATGIWTVPEASGSLLIEPLLVTSDLAYGKTNVEATSIDYEEGDIDGPMDVAVAISNDETGLKAIVIGTDSILDETVNTAIVGENYDFILSAVNWTQDKENGLYIPSKTAPDTYVFMNQGAQAAVVFICLILIPAAVFGAGAFLLAKRRKRSEKE